MQHSFLDFKQLPPAKNSEILSGLLPESERRKAGRLCVENVV